VEIFGTVPEREQLARRLSAQLWQAGDGGAGRPGPDYKAGGVAEAYLSARRITIAQDDDGFSLQVEVDGDILPWLHGVPDGATVKAVTEYRRTRWLVYDGSGIRVGVIFHGVGNMWQWRFMHA
jgi:hypothetical protein